jgi:metal-sulfur cluster biosynthetic enzyme
VAGSTPVEVRITFEPPWTPERITPDGRALLGG